MKRIGLRIAALVVTLGVLAFPVLAGLIPDTSASGPDPVRITSYDARYSVDAEGTLTATERLTTEFPYGRHGIFRFWDLRDPSDDRVRLVPRDVDVTLDGAPVPFDLLWEGGRQYRVAKIGDPDSYVTPGSHEYVISYRVDGALSPVTAGQGDEESSSWTQDQGAQSVLYWNVVAPGWGMDIDRARIQVDLPVDAGRVQCTSSADESGPCRISGDGTRSVTIEADALPPRTPVTVRIGLDTPTPDRVSVPWPIALDRVLGRSEGAVVTVLLITLAAAAAGYLLDLASRERKPGYPVTYEPPKGLGPVQTAYVVDEEVPDRALVATLLYQAEQGLTDLTERDGTWTVTGTGDDEAWRKTDDVTRFVGTSLGVTSPGSTFTAAKRSVSAGQTLNTTQNGIKGATTAWARGIKAERSAGHEWIARLAVVLAVVVVVVLALFVQISVLMWILPFAGFAIGGAGLMVAGVGRRRTAFGRQLWSWAGGFRRMLSTDSAEARFDFSARAELYTAFIPFAVAFDCADRWARKYRTETGVEAPVPVWYSGPSSSSGVGLFGGGDAFSSFESSLSSSISAYAATQSSSSSGGGGGGFSGGGGGGGGGGGSW